VPRNIKISLLVMGAVTVASIAYFLVIAQRIRSTAGIEEETSFGEAEVPAYEPTDPPVEVRLFLPGTNNDVLLRTRNTTIFASADVRGRARQIVDHLIGGVDDEDIFYRLPDETRLNQVFVSPEGTAYLDFNNALSDNHPGGVLPEQATIYAIVNSLTYNLPEVDRVKILIGGVEKETLRGHCLLLLPLELDLSITDIAPLAMLSNQSLFNR
jgi:hypothetical protein